MTKLALRMAVMLALTGEARADFMDGNALYAACTSSALADQRECLGYVVGIVDYMEWMRHGQAAPKCVPDGTVAQQVTDVVVNYFRDHPEKRSHAASLSVFFAVYQAWHCQ